MRERTLIKQEIHTENLVITLGPCIHVSSRRNRDNRRVSMVRMETIVSEGKQITVYWGPEDQ